MASIETGAYLAFVVDYNTANPLPAGVRKYDIDVCTPNKLERIEGVGAIGDFWPDPIETLPLAKDRPVVVLHVHGNWYLASVERPAFAECESAGESSKANVLRSIMLMTATEKEILRRAING